MTFLSKIQAFTLLEAEIQRQDSIHPAGFPATRDGIFMAISTAAHEELEREAMEAWRAARATQDWTHVQEEMIQAAAVLMRCARSIEESK